MNTIWYLNSMALSAEKLTNNQQTVLDLLEKSKEPLKAYAILYDT